MLAIRQGRAFPWASRTGETPGGSGAGCHVGGEDVVGVAVEILASPVVAHRCEMKSRRVSGHGGWRIKGGGWRRDRVSIQILSPPWHASWVTGGCEACGSAQGSSFRPGITGWGRPDGSGEAP